MSSLNDYIIIIQGGVSMQKYECSVCGYIYNPVEGDPDNGVAPGTSFDKLSEDWVCPVCSVGKDQFELAK